MTASPEKKPTPIALAASPATDKPAKKSILLAMAERFGMEPEAFEATVRATCFPANPPATREEFAAGMQIAHKLELNPLTKEVHFARLKGGGVQAIIGVDGWYTMANKHPNYDGCDFKLIRDDKGKVTEIECTIYRKDRTRPTIISELMVECQRGTEPWKLTPTRMLRHRAFGQCARLAFAFAGVMDEDEYGRWQDLKDVTPKAPLLDVPDIPDEPETQDALPLDLNQDTEPLANVGVYLANLDENMSVAGDLEILGEIWEGHLELADRLPGDDQLKAETAYERHEKRLKGK